MGTLSIVATPIGNLEDITLRAIRTLKEADAIFAEDTRVASKLLSRYEIPTKAFRLDANTEHVKAKEIVERLQNGERIAYVSDAGTPGISDPGPRLVAFVRNELPEATIETIPGPSALAAAIAIAGVQFDEFVFKGFLPHKKGRKTALEEIAREERPVILFESVHRIEKLLGELSLILGEKKLLVGRELTKIHEEMLRGTALEVLKSLEERGAVRGEFVVIIPNK